MTKEISKKQKLIFWSIIMLFNLLLIVAIYLVFYLEVVQLGWVNEQVAKYEYKKDKSLSKRVLVLGDSQLEKWPMEHCLYKDLKRFCNDNDIGYVNAAHHGFGPTEYVNELNIIAKDYNPNLILLFYYAGNDLSDVMYREYDDPRERTYEVIFNDKKPITPVSKTLKDTTEVTEEEKKSRLNNSSFDWEKFKKQGVDSVMIHYAKQRIIYPNRIGAEYVNPYVLLIGSSEPEYLLDNLAVHDKRAKYNWVKILRKFENLLSIAEEINSEVYLVCIPSTMQVDTSHMDFYRKCAFIVNNDLVNQRVPQDLLGEFSEASNIPYVDLLPIFKQSNSTEDLYFENDGHLSEEGHKLAFKKIKKDLLIPFLDGKSKPRKKERQINFYENYHHWQVDYKMERLKKNLGLTDSK